MVTIDIIYAAAGGGHLATARSLKKALLAESTSFSVRLLNFSQDISRPYSPILSRFGAFLEQFYNHFVLNRGHYWVAPIYYGINLLTAILFFNKGQQNLNRFINDNGRPDLVISVMPLVNEIIGCTLQKLKIPFWIVTSDLVDLSSTGWLTRKAVQNAERVFTATSAATQYVRQLDHLSDTCTQHGLVIDPEFYKHTTNGSTDIPSTHAPENPDELLKIMLLYGGQGSNDMYAILRHLERLARRVRILVCCGHNKRLLSKVKQYRAISHHDIVPMGYTEQLPHFMAQCSLVITKPGPGTIWEALTMQVPLLLDTRKILPQEQANVHYVVDRGYGVEWDRLATLGKCIASMRLADIRRTLGKFLHGSTAQFVARAVKLRLYL